MAINHPSLNGGKIDHAVHNMHDVGPLVKPHVARILLMPLFAHGFFQILRIPWLSIMTSRPVWAMIIAHTCSNWGGYTLLTSLPMYMSEVLHYDIKQVKQDLNRPRPILK